MELKEPIRKRHYSQIDAKPPFPIITGNKSGILGDESIYVTYTGHFNGQSVIVDDPEEIMCLFTMGFFGKGSLSRSYPKFCKNKGSFPRVLKERQWAYRLKWLNKLKELDSTPSKDLESTPKEEIVSREINDMKNTSPSTSKNTSENCEGIKEVIEKEEKNTQKDLEDSNKAEKPQVISNNKRGITESNNEVQQSEPKRLCPSQEECKQDDADLKNITNSTNRSIEITLGEESKEQTSEVLVIADSDSEIEEKFDSLKPHIEKEQIKTVYEELHLTLEEAFFLSFGLGCLEVVDVSGDFLSINSMWKLYREAKKDFIEKYITYHHFRSKGWVVKPGIKFGGDFILYKKGPTFYHASYIVLTEVMNHKLIKSSDKHGKLMTWSYLAGLNRLAETTNKEILLCQIQWPEKITSEEMNSPMVLKKFKVNEVILRRWQATQERDP